MGKTVTLGGDRLGSGNRNKVQLQEFARSTFDRGFVWRNTQSVGTLVPFLCDLALPGDTYDLNLGADVKTHPTIGPLFSSFKLQLDVFECPIRLYHAWLHNNKLNIGNKMNTVKLPQMVIENPNPLILTDVIQAATNENWEHVAPPIDVQQINPSSELSYIGLKGFGNVPLVTNDGQLQIQKNALPKLAISDIYKNYYANKQEEVGAVIHYDEDIHSYDELTITLEGAPFYNGTTYNINKLTPSLGTYEFTVNYYGAIEPLAFILWYIDGDEIGGIHSLPKSMSLINYTATPITGGWELYGEFEQTGIDYIFIGVEGVTGEDEMTYLEKLNSIKNKIHIELFDLKNIDDMREAILSHNYTYPYTINEDSEIPFRCGLNKIKWAGSTGQTTAICSQEGLFLKTYQSDIFNNWLNTEWIDGEGGINSITAVDTTDGNFTIDALNLAKKVYQMLVNIAVSDGTYQSWVEAVYDHSPYFKAETPMYHGGLSKEIIFQEVISQSQTDNQPLGTLAGRGQMSNKHKGGQVTIKVNEPSYIIGLVSITPRIDYYQGEEFYMRHLTMDDLHKPNLDAIGFQDLVTTKLAWWDSEYTWDGSTHNEILKSAGKQPAWIDYMTNYNKLFGNFAEQDNEMFMTLARRYEPEYLLDTLQIKDLTTYIDPTKFNYTFAQTSLDAMNFWVQIGVDMTVRRKMSSKLMPQV